MLRKRKKENAVLKKEIQRSCGDGLENIVDDKEISEKKR